MKASFFALAIALSTFFIPTEAQSLVGTWQLVSHTTCLEAEMGEDDADTDKLLDNIRSRASRYPGVIRFKADNSGDERIQLLDARKPGKRNKFLYRYSEGKLYFLDKKTRLLVGSYDVDRLSTDSLVFSDAKRACETRIFVRLAGD